MSAALPIPFEWCGDSFAPVGARAKAECDNHFVVGARYRLVEEQERSGAQHRFFFANVNETWQTMTEEQLERWPSSESLRKWGLIKAGYCDSRQIVCASKAEAVKIAAFIRPMDVYAIVTVNEKVVTVFTAHSQSVRSMGKKLFEASCDKVLHIIAQEIGARPEDLGKAA